MRRRACVAALAVAALAGNAGAANADVDGWNFEPGWFTAGAPFHGQGGWSMQSTFDVDVVTASTYGSPAGFGSQSLRASNAFASGGFANQPHSPSLADPAGETSSVALAGSSGDRQPHFDMRFQFRSAAAGSQQAGLAVQVAATDNLGSRQSVLVLQDGATGLEVRLFDTPNPACLSGAAGCVAFRQTTVAGGLTRGDVHRVRLTLDFVEGPDNDVAQVFVDGSLRFTGESWENYYRNDPEQAASGNAVPLIDTVSLRMNQLAAGTMGNGFLIDNVRVQSAPAASTDGGTILPSPPGTRIPGQPGAATPMRILAAGLNRTGIVRARLVCPPEAGQCSASITVRGDGNVLARRDLVRSAGTRVTIHLRLSRARLAKLRRADRRTITVFSRNQDGIGSRIRQRLPRL